MRPPIMQTDFCNVRPLCFVLLVTSLLSCYSCQPQTARTAEFYNEKLAHGSSAERMKIAHEIVHNEFMIRQTMPELAKVALHDQDQNTRVAADVALRALGLDTVIDPRELAEQVLLPALRDGSAEARLRALMMLADMGEDAQAVAPTLVRMLREGKAELTGETPLIIETLGKMGPAPGVIPEIMRLYMADSDPITRAEGGMALARLNVTEVIPELTKDLASEQPWLRGYAAAALENFGALLPEDTIQKLAALADDEDEWVRRAAVKALGASGNNSKVVMDAVAKCLADPEPLVRRFATEAAVNLRLGRQDIIQELVAMAHGKDYWQLVRAERALDAIGIKAVPALIKILGDGEPNDRHVAARALAKASEEGAQAVAKAAKSDDMAMALAALDGMQRGEVYAELFSEAVAKAMSNPFLRDDALLIAMHLGLSSDEVIDAIIKFLQDGRESSERRARAAKALGELGRDSEKAARALRAASTDKDSRVAKAARDALLQTNQ